APAAVDDHAGAGPGQALRDRKSDPGCRSADDGALAGQIDVHGIPPWQPLAGASGEARDSDYSVTGFSPDCCGSASLAPIISCARDERIGRVRRLRRGSIVAAMPT